jgi:hypothetical protein
MAGFMLEMLGNSRWFSIRIYVWMSGGCQMGKGEKIASSDKESDINSLKDKLQYQAKKCLVSNSF